MQSSVCALLSTKILSVDNHPDAEALYTSAGQGEGSPQPFYERYGFVPTGQIVEDEVVLRLDLRGS